VIEEDGSELNVMKRNESVAVVLLALFSISLVSLVHAAPHRGGSKGRRRHRSAQYECSAPNNSTYFLRSSCSEGEMVTIHRGRVILQLDGLKRYDPLAAFEKESCTLVRRGGHRAPHHHLLDSGPPVVRYKHRRSGRYICFSRKGRLRTWGPRAVESKGERCMFREGLLGEEEEHRNTYHTIQSAAPHGYYVGFKMARGSSIALQGYGRSGRGAMARVGQRTPGASCGFRFHGERRRRRRKQNKEDALLDSILQYIEDNEVGRKEGEEEPAQASSLVRLHETLDTEEEKGSDINRVDLNKVRRGNRGRRRGLKRPKVRHLSKKQLRPNRKEKNRRREQNSKRRQSMRRRPSQ